MALCFEAGVDIDYLTIGGLYRDVALLVTPRQFKARPFATGAVVQEHERAGMV
jgi:hypothetical protein